MNQILCNKPFRRKKIKKYKIQLYISIFLFNLLALYFIFYLINLKNNSKSTRKLLNTLNVEMLYTSSESKYKTISLNNTIINIIGIIEIPKISIKYPIISEISDELLQIAPCKFYGPNPNEIGNLCIAAHNYNDNSFFGNLYKLETGDLIYIYDINGIKNTYSLVYKYETSISDTSCTSQYTLGMKQVTLVTCNNKNKKRLIVIASEIN